MDSTGTWGDPESEDVVLWVPVSTGESRMMRIGLTARGVELDLYEADGPPRTVGWSYDELASIAFGAG